jgi:hypothetical protein
LEKGTKHTMTAPSAWLACARNTLKLPGTGAAATARPAETAPDTLLAGPRNTLELILARARRGAFPSF